MPKYDEGAKYVAYDVSGSFNTVYPVANKVVLPKGQKDVNPQDAYLSM